MKVTLRAGGWNTPTLTSQPSEANTASARSCRKRPARSSAPSLGPIPAAGQWDQGSGPLVAEKRREPPRGRAPAPGQGSPHRPWGCWRRRSPHPASAGLERRWPRSPARAWVRHSARLTCAPPRSIRAPGRSPAAVPVLPSAGTILPVPQGTPFALAKPRPSQ